MRATRIAGIVALWLVQGLAAAALFVAGVAKFGNAGWERSFAHWGYPPGFVLVVGAAEALGALCLLVPRLASYAAAFLGVIMVGAAVTHLVHGERFTMPLLYLCLLTLAGLGRRRWALRRRPAVAVA
jgi:uncharacterized membrane protein YphA (DoxX/SURF4 family)